MPHSISIIIPSRNRSPVLARTLASLQALRIPPDTAVELIVVANACTDDTVAVAQRAMPSLPFPARCVSESTLGAGAARNRGIRESHHALIACLDDDISIEPDWLAGLLDVFDGHPADLVAGRVTLWWEAVARPDWLDRRTEHLLSCVDYGDQAIELSQPGQAISANLAFRRTVPDHIGLFSIGFGRGGHMAGGEDPDFILRALRAGHRMFYAPHAAIRHWVAPERITPEYLAHCAFGNGLARPYQYPRLTSLGAILAIVRYTLRFSAYVFLERLARVLGNRRMQMNNHVRLYTCIGNVFGTYRRWRGISRIPTSANPA